MEHFLGLICGGDEEGGGSAEPSVTGKMVMAVTKVCSACEESAKSGMPVDITWTKDEIPEEYCMKNVSN